MDHNGQAFGVNLFRLWEMAAIDVPAVASRIVDAEHQIAGIESFYVGGGEGTQQVVSAWVEAGASLRTTLSQSVQNSYDACDALMRIAELYAEADHGNAASIEFAKRRDDEIDKHAADYPPTVFPTPASRPQLVVEADQF